MSLKLCRDIMNDGYALRCQEWLITTTDTNYYSLMILSNVNNNIVKNYNWRLWNPN